ncbi:uncharacterized protein LOC122884538 [Siniperca chuatsi]|uniref:uncharacterized protein LOC122884538 n=1 Tax=Siniperca chuatsi TaxID=119488 RepID=UPI001CE02C1D|nr:uncharacterized protein LOC122884538 [Siniperca chuatsi]XP_044070503.1 uncharacterized protein LOC122884538 [Siniperca chuatsi]
MSCLGWSTCSARAPVNLDPSLFRTLSTMDLVQRRRWFSLGSPIQILRQTRRTRATWRHMTVCWMPSCPTLRSPATKPPLFTLQTLRLPAVQTLFLAFKSWKCHLHLICTPTSSTTPASIPPSTRLPPDGICAHTQHGRDKGKDRHNHATLPGSTTTATCASASDKNPCHLYHHQTCALPLCIYSNPWDCWPLHTAHNACQSGSAHNAHY